MTSGFISLFTDVRVDGFALWVVLLICAGVFLASFMDAIAGGGGIISVPTYLIAFTGLPTYYALGTNKLSAGIGTVFSTARFIKNGYVNWRLFAPSIVLALLGSMGGTWLQLHTPDKVLKYLLLVVLPIVAFVTLRNREWPDEPGEIDFKKQAAIVWAGALVIGAYDGYYGPGTGTFLMLIFIRLAKMDTRHAAGGVKVINLSSNIGSLITALMAGKVLIGVGLIAAVASIAGHYIGAGLAIKNGSRIVRPTVIIVLILLTVKVGSELLFPEFWS
ncbi:sulfite exporter TauE/SafE family protein [Dysosmobacter sp.]|uniref:sulfite exporter TauE/SafE family protein n=1 Tax=Dysosmobacter sp. TaxID=2591382 RepID=UPI002A852F12|nr:TSUP family transporter [Dysosmobacter sp.]MDY3985545.1 TSUP family transporter [Dysosmobacter sp.]